MSPNPDSATQLHEELGAINYQLNELTKKSDEDWTDSDTSTFNKLSERHQELKTRLGAIDEAKARDAETKRERDVTKAFTGLSHGDQEEIYWRWFGSFCRYLRGGMNALNHRDMEALAIVERMKDRGWDMDRAEFGRVMHLAKRDQNIGTPADGGYLTHPEFGGRVIQAMKQYQSISRVATTITTRTGSSLYYPTTGIDKGEIVDEAGAVTADTGADIAFSQVELKAYKFSSKYVKVSLELLQDAEIADFEGFIVDRLASRIARSQEEKFLVGTGTDATPDEPTGVVTDAVVGKEIADGGTNDFSAWASWDNVIDLYHSVDPAYRADPSCAWLMNDTFIGALRKIDNTDNKNLLWQPSMQAGEPDRLSGKPVIAASDMLDAVDAHDEKFMLFGAMKHYIIRRVRQMTMVRASELFSANGQIGFVAFMRADGKLAKGEGASDGPIKAMAAEPSG